jgi:1,2-diacylglycerol 3-alpha-glucosyltransferase
MKILFASQTYGSQTNGQSVFVTHLAEGLAKNGHQVMVLMPSDRIFSYREIHNNVSIQLIHAVPLAPYYPDVHIAFLPNPVSEHRIDEFRPDLIHIQDHYPLCRGVLDAALARDIPLVATNHFLPDNIIQNVPLFRHYHNLFDDVLWGMVLETYNQVEVVTAPTETAANILRSQNIRVPVKAITCGVNLHVFKPDPSVDKVRMRQKYGLNTEATVFMYVGRLDQEKHIDILIEAFQQLDHEKIQLAITGKGNFSKDLHQMVIDLDLEDMVIFTGFVPEEDLPHLLNSVDIFAMPSDAELQSIATLEAMGTGLPVLAANAEALPELVRHGVNGYLFEPGNVADAAKHIQKFIDNRDQWKSMSAASLEIVQPHHLPNMVKKYTHLYQSILN